MNRLSSRITYFYKWAFPAVWFGFLAMMIVVITVGSVRKQEYWGILAVLAFFSAFGGFGYLVLRMYVFDLADEVWDEGSALRVKRRRQQERIAFTNILNVSYSGLQNPPRVSLTLRTPSVFGSEIAFMPRYRVFPFRTPPEVFDLMNRVDAARRNPSN